jgi:hypothetical protein
MERSFVKLDVRFLSPVQHLAASLPDRLLILPPL